MVDKLLYLSVNSTVVKSELPTDPEQESTSLVISGYASTPDVDRQGDVVPVSVWEKGMTNYLKNPVILAFHNHDNPVGRMIDYRVDHKGLWIKARISNAAKNVFELVRDGVLTAFSIGFRIVDAEYKQETELFVVKELELHEISVVSVPANQNTLFSLAKAFDSANEYQSFKMQFAPKSESAKGLESSTEAESKPTSKEWKMSPEEIKQVLADAARQAAEDATKAVMAQQERAAKEKAAKEAAEAELEAKIKAAVASTVQVGESGAERLLAEVEKRFAEQAEQSRSAIAGLEAALKEKAAEIETINRSKMSFADGSKDRAGLSYNDKEKAILLSKMTGKSLEQTGFGRDLVQKYNGTFNDHVPSATWEKEVSMQMEAEMRRKLVVAPIFRQIEMKTNVMTIPVNPEGGLATWMANTSFGAAASRGTDRSGYNGDGGAHALKEITLNAYKVATNEYLAYEEEEDALLAVMPIVRDGMIRRVARSIDKAFLLGAGAGADPVGGLTTLATGTNITTGVSAAAANSVTVGTLRTLRKNLGAWGLDPAGLVYIVTTHAYYSLLEDSAFQTNQQVGVDNATLLTGQIGTVGNSPVLVSGEFDAPAASTVGAFAVAPGNFLVGNQRGLRVDTQELVETQRRVMVASMRTGMVKISSNQGAGVSKLVYVA